MAYLLDTNILLRIAQPGHPMHQEARKSVQTLLRRKEAVHIVPQVICEFWVVATRPVASNGLGMSRDEVKRKVSKAELFFRLTLDTRLSTGSGCDWWMATRFWESPPMTQDLWLR